MFRRVADVAMAVCGSPAYLAQRGVPRTPEGLRDHDLLAIKGAPVDRQWGSRATPA